MSAKKSALAPVEKNPRKGGRERRGALMVDLGTEGRAALERICASLAGPNMPPVRLREAILELIRRADAESAN